MPWWGWLLIGCLLSACLGLAISSIFRKKTLVFGLTEEEKKALIAVEKERIEKDAMITKKANEELIQLAKGLQEKLYVLGELYDEAKQSINEDRQKDFEKYLNDASLIDGKLDELLGNRSDSPSK